MPAQPSWLLRVPEILGLVRGSKSAFFDRESIESMFKVRRRQAIDLMHRMGGLLPGRESAHCGARPPRGTGFTPSPSAPSSAGSVRQESGGSELVLMRARSRGTVEAAI